MAQSLIEMAKDLVLALVQAGRVSPEQMPSLIGATHQQLLSLQVIEQSGPAPTLTPAVDWKQSITKHTVHCLECGLLFKQLSTRHLRQHDLDSRSYRRKYGIPPTQSLSTKAATARRKEIMRQNRAWEKSPVYRKTQGQNGEGVEAAPVAPPPPARAKRKTSAKTKAKRPVARKRS